MLTASKAGVLPRAVVAALLGTVVGTAAGVWSMRQPAASVAVTASRAETDARSMSTTEPTRALASGGAPLAEDEAQTLQRARTLARRPDVTALMSLRDDIVRRATERGIAGTSSIKRELDEIDLRLNEARLLQLKLDAEELRKVDSKGTR